uniref:Putative methyltransferase n=1 Tax=viral metagenome TaxID=1070528 RepID=A0A6M3L7K3_9ZZZZ
MNWSERAKTYNNLPAQKQKVLVAEMLKLGKVKPGHKVLDVGTGTGIMANALAPLCKSVIAVDTNIGMAYENKWEGNKTFIWNDITRLSFPENYFHRIFGRKVFHQVGDIGRAFSECFRVLKHGGRIVVAQPVPADAGIEHEYKRIFKLKDDRNVYLENDYFRFMMEAGFKNIYSEPYIFKSMSVYEWLNGSAIPIRQQLQILKLHENASDEYKKAYNMRLEEGDCFIDVKFVIMTGEK